MSPRAGRWTHARRGANPVSPRARLLANPEAPVGSEASAGLSTENPPIEVALLFPTLPPPSEALPTAAVLQRNWACATVLAVQRTTQGDRLRLLLGGT